MEKNTILEIRNMNISFSQYQKGTKQTKLPVIRDLSLTVHQGEMVAVVGSSGSGKTTLGRKLAQELGYPYFDIDDYLWRKDTPIPFTRMYSRQEKASALSEEKRLLWFLRALPTWIL